MCALLSTLAVTGTLLCVTTAFELTVSIPSLVLAAFAASLLFTWGFQSGHFLWTLIPLALLLVLLWLTGGFGTLRITWLQLSHDILTRFSSAYKNISFSIPEAPTAGRGNLTLLFSIAAILLSVWMSWGVGYRSCLISVAGTLPFLLLCVIINDTPPSALPLVLLVAVWITVLLARERDNEAPILDATRIMLTLLAVLLVFGIVGAVYPKEDTSSQTLPEFIDSLLDKLPEQLQDLMGRDSVGGSSAQLGADTSDVLDLTTQGIRSRTEDIMMQLSSTEEGALYLRAVSKNIYTGTSWESDDSATAAESQYAHTSLGAAYGETLQAAVQIKNYRDNTAVGFIPYGYISCTSADTLTSDLRINVLEDDYIIYYWPGVSTLDLTQPGTQVNAEYDAYVQETCTGLPDDTAETLYDLAVSYGYDPDMTQAQTISWVAEFVRNIGTYNLNVSCQPSNLDFAVYFLTESRQGYCVHFATAACALYRALGIPSRYASGYRVTVTEAGTVVDVTDADTHAWAEVYLSGYGWIPVETTPGFGETSALPELEEEQEPSEEPQESEEPDDSKEEPSEMEDEMQAEPSPEVTEETDGEAESEPAPPEETEVSPDDADAAEYETMDQAEVYQDSPRHISALYYLLLALLIPIAAIAAIILRHAVLRGRRQAELDSSERNAAVIAVWAYLERLERYQVELPDELKAIALKAKFSQHTLTDEELLPYLQAASDIQSGCISGLSFLQRLLFRWIYVLDLELPT